jgi:hypothetical protein
VDYITRSVKNAKDKDGNVFRILKGKETMVTNLNIPILLAAA